MTQSMLRQWLRRSFIRTRRAAVRQRNRFVPRLEPLEDRRLLSAGALDPTFGTGGKVTTPFLGAASTQAQATAVQADGKVLVGGSVHNDFLLLRYNSNGSLDTSFGNQGVVTTDINNGSTDDITCLALQADGKIVVAGSTSPASYSNPQFAVARYNADGSLDPTFGTGGIVTFSFNFADSASAVTLLSDGKIAVAGETEWNSAFAVAVLESDGSLDTNFGGTGEVTTSFPTAYGPTFVTGIAVQTVGTEEELVATGNSISFDSTNYVYFSEFALARYHLDGSLDTGFGSGGLVTTNFDTDSSDHANGVCVQSDGKLVLAGWSQDVFNPQELALARYNLDGSLDTSFGTGGLVTTQVGGYYDPTYLSAVAVQANGQIVATGQDPNGFLTARYNADGSLDPTFGAAGLVSTYVAGLHDGAAAVALQADGKLVVAGNYQTLSLNASDLAVVRYNADGSLDSSWNQTGIVTTELHGPASGASYTKVAARSDGKLDVLEVGYGNSNVTQFNADGSLDTRFGQGGTVYLDFAAAQMTLQGDGKLVVVGTGASPISGGNDFWVARLNLDGSFDATFGTDGEVTTAFPSSYDPSSNDNASATSVVIQTDGKIVVGGQAQDWAAYGEQSFALARYNTDGSLDTSFGTNGETTSLFSPWYSSTITGLALETVGGVQDVVAIGLTDWNGDWSVARYAASGSLDTTFGSNGLVTTNFPAPNSYAASPAGVVVQDDGKIVVAGTVGYQGSYGVARYNLDGSLDGTFGTAGLVVNHFQTSSSDEVTGLVLQANGKMVVAGLSNNNFGSPSFALARLKSDGSLDASFGTSGVALNAFPDGSGGLGTGVAIQPDGKIVQAGVTYWMATGYSQVDLLRVLNNPPLLPQVSGPATAVRGQPLTFTFAAAYATGFNPASSFTYTINWGDGSPLQTIPATPGNGAGVALAHIFTTNGAYTIQVTARDQDEEVGTKTSRLQVVTWQLQTDPANPKLIDLVVGGTLGNDTITFTPGKAAGRVVATLNGTVLGTFQPTGRIEAYGQDGNDTISVDKHIVLAALLSGGAGNDTLMAGGGPTILLGGPGNDVLNAGSGRDLLIGGSGSDHLNGAGDGDLLIAGTTAYDNNEAALWSIEAEWARTDKTYQQRIQDLVLGGGSNGSNVLNTSTVLDDGAVDYLTGGPGLDWFFASRNDVLSKVSPLERIN